MMLPETQAFRAVRRRRDLDASEGFMVSCDPQDKLLVYCNGENFGLVLVEARGVEW
jgi:hypothetical protein